MESADLINGNVLENVAELTEGDKVDIEVIEDAYPYHTIALFGAKGS